jgi:hypothetical protein
LSLELFGLLVLAVRDTNHSARTHPLLFLSSILARITVIHWFSFVEKAPLSRKKEDFSFNIHFPLRHL